MTLITLCVICFSLVSCGEEKSTNTYPSLVSENLERLKDNGFKELGSMEMSVSAGDQALKDVGTFRLDEITEVSFGHQITFNASLVEGDSLSKMTVEADNAVIVEGKSHTLALYFSPCFGDNPNDLHTRLSALKKLK